MIETILYIDGKIEKNQKNKRGNFLILITIALSPFLFYSVIIKQ